MEVIFFSVADTTYIARLDSLAEVLMPATLRPLPAGPAFVRGLMNLRGRVLPVIDLRERLRLPPRNAFLRGNRILRVPTAAGELGVAVDAVLRITLLDQAQRRADDSGALAEHDLAGPFWRVGEDLLQELRLERVLSGEEIRALGWQPGDGQSDGNRLLEPDPNESQRS